MKILIDENIDVGFKDYFTGYDIQTVHDLGWQSKQNGELMKLTNDAGFDYFITLDKNIKHQQNLKKLKFKIILLHSKNSKIDTLKEFIQKIIDSIKSGTEEILIEIF